MDKRVLLRHSGSYVFCMENQQYLLDNIGPMFVEQEKNKAAAEAQTLQPDAEGNVTLPTTGAITAPIVNEEVSKPGAP